MSFKNEQGSTLYFLLLYYGFLELGSIWEDYEREREPVPREEHAGTRYGLKNGRQLGGGGTHL